MRRYYPSRELLQLLILVTIFVLLPLYFRGVYHIRLLNLMVIYALLAIALNIVFGHAKQLWLCQGTCAGLGCYVATLLAKWYVVNPWQVIPLGVLLSTTVGGVISYTATLRGLEIISLGIVTLALQLIFENVVSGLEEITYGTTGFIPPELPLGPIRDLLGRDLSYYFLFVTLLLLTVLMYMFIIRSPLGVALSMIANDEVTARFSGVNVIKYKVIAALIGTALMGLVGALYAFYNRYVVVTLFTLPSVDVIVLVMLVFGGRETALGPVLGAIIFTLVNEILRPLGPLTVVFYGAMLLILFVFFREGLVAYLRRLLRIPII